MRIELEKLTSRVSDFAHLYEPAELDLADEEVCLIKPLEIKGKVVKSDTQVRIEGRLKTTAEISCDRCLSKVCVEVEDDFDVLYVPDSIYDVADKLELNEDDLTLSVFDGFAIDISEIATEQFYLALPSRVLCKEDCLGLCPKCGVNKNNRDCSCEKEEIDPRWAALKDLK